MCKMKPIKQLMGWEISLIQTVLTIIRKMEKYEANAINHFSKNKI